MDGSARKAPGLQVRALRRRRNMTLEQLSVEVGVSKGHLSRFERGQKFLSVDALLRLSTALSTPVSTLLGQSPGEEAIHVLRHSERKEIQVEHQDGSYAYSVLSRPVSGSGANVFVIHLAQGTLLTTDAFHGGEEAFYVLSGRVSVTLGRRELLLEAGDFVSFPGQLYHRMHGLQENSSILVFVTKADSEGGGGTAV